MKRKITKKIAKIFLWVLGIFITLDLLLVLLFFIPSVQNTVVKQVTSYISSNWGSDIEIGKIYITPSLKLAFRDLVIKDNHQNPMIRVKEGKTRLKNFDLNPVSLSFHSLEVSGADVALMKYDGEDAVNIGLWARKLKNNEEKKGFFLRADRLIMEKSRFSFTNESTQQNDGTDPLMDYAFFELKDIQLKTTDFRVNGADISADITKIAFHQYTGFELSDGSAHFRINEHSLIFNQGKLVSPNSLIYLDLVFSYDSWSSYSSFVDSVIIRADVRPSEIDMRDIATFAPALMNMDQLVVFSGKVSGPVNDLHLQNFRMHYGEDTFIAGDLTLGPVTDFRNAAMDFVIKDSYVNMKDLAGFPLPGKRTLSLPQEVLDIGTARLTGYFTGGWTHFDSELHIKSDMGDITADLHVTDRDGTLYWDGNAETRQFHLAKLLQEPEFFGFVDMAFRIDGKTPAQSSIKDFVANSTGNLKGNITRFDLLKYPLHDIQIAGRIENNTYGANLISADTNIAFRFNGLADLSNQTPNFRASVSLQKLFPRELVTHVPPVDSVEAKGFDNFLLFLQKNPGIVLSFDSLEMNMNGNRLDALNGFVSVDGISYQNEEDRVRGERIRLTAINVESGLHKFILASNFLNATMTTNYELSSLKDSLMSVAYRYFPNLLPENPNRGIYDSLPPPEKEYYFRLSLETFQSRELMDLFLPGIRIAPLSTAELYFSSLKTKDSIQIHTRNFRYRNAVQVFNFSASGKGGDDDAFNLFFGSDSVVFPQKKNNIVFKDIKINTIVRENVIRYEMNWMNPDAISNEETYLAGYVDAGNKEDIVIQFTSSAIQINDKKWAFDPQHSIHIRRSYIDFQNVLLEAAPSRISVNGVYSFQKKDDLSIDIKNVDLTQFNAFAENINLSFGGDVSARIRINSWSSQRLITGKILASDFVFNGESFGNLFLTAAVPEGSLIGFGGGLFGRDHPFNSAIVDQYTMRNYNQEKEKIANLSGSFETVTKSLEVKAGIDTLRIGFLSPFLQSFSQMVSGTAGGDLTFIANPDSTYFKGKIKVQKGYLGIKPLNTVYELRNQVIEFTQEGMEFDRILVYDVDGNRGVLNGHIYHNKFRDFVLDLSVETDRLQVLNAPRETDSYFYGTGYVAGRVSIFGNTEKIFFQGNNLRTLSGTKVYLPLTFSDRLSETQGIRFKKSPGPGASDPSGKNERASSSTELDFDFIFDITRDADIQLDLDPSIGGSLTARAEGTLQLTYNTQSNLNLIGTVNIATGRFSMSLKDILLNARFDLISGGTVSFNGPIENSVLNASAVYKTTASLKEILPEETTRRVPVNSYINLRGNLMNPDIGFSFELPDHNEEKNAMFNNAIDTSNANNVARQFFSLLLFSRFASNTENTEQLGSDFGGTGIEMLSGILSNFISQQFKYGELGVNYKVADRTHAAEYSVNASIPVWNDRVIIQTNLGYADGSNTEEGAASYIIGDVSLEFLLNEEGNWRLRAFYSSNDNSAPSIEYQSKTGTGGIALIYKKEFNNGKDFLESFRRKPKNKKVKKESRNE